jgi:hypothetical protein
MPSPIDDFPVEVFEYVVSNLSMGDLFLLLQVSKAYQTFLEPLLWTGIEMHRRDFHVQNAHDSLRAEEATERPKLPYDNGPECDGEIHDLDTNAHGRAEKFLKTFSTHKKWGKGLSEVRRSYLGSLIKWLCLPINPGLPYAHPDDIDPWNSFASFVNLEYLEISGFWVPPSTSTPFSTPERGLAKLRTLKLRGYFPKEFVQWLLKEPACIEELQLGIIDAPVGRDEEFVKSESLEDFSHEYCAPRALACLTVDIMGRLTNLKRLYLCKPANGDKEDEHYGTLFFSKPSDRRILEEWNALLRATRKTLEHLTLDQRPVADENVADGTINKAYVRRCANGPSYQRFVKMVLPALLEDDACTNLKVIRLFGFERDDEGVDVECYGDPDYPDGSVDVPSQLQAAFPSAEVRSYGGRRMIIWNDSGEILSGE